MGVVGAVAVAGPGYEGLIIRNKALRLGADVPDDVVDFLADNINANVREIEGALSSLVANASFLGKKITVTLAKEILKVYVQFTQKEITIDHIQKVVCEYLGLPEEKFKSPRRTREIAQGAPDRDVPEQTAYESAADYYRGFDRRKEPCDGTPMPARRFRT